MCRTYNGLLIGIQGEEDRTKEWYVKATSEQAQLMGQISVLYFSFTILISAFLFYHIDFCISFDVICPE